MKCKGGGSYFYKNQKYRWLRKEKESDILCQKFLTFLYGLFRQSIPLTQWAIPFFICTGVWM